MLPPLSQNGNYYVTVVKVVLGLVSLVLGVFDLWPAYLINQAFAGLSGQTFYKLPGVAALLLASFLISYAVGYGYELLTQKDDHRAPRPKGRPRRPPPR